MKDFREEQRFNQIWVWVILIAPMVMVFSQFAIAFTDKEGFKHEDIIALSSLILLFTSLIIWFRRMVLITTISEKGIYIRYKGLFTKKHFPKSDIVKVELVTYDPLWHYGGWGLRYSSKRGWCYNVAGDKGCKLTLKNGKAVMIGTQQSKEMQEVMNALNYPL